MSEVKITNSPLETKGTTTISNGWATVQPNWLQTGVRFCHWAASEVTGTGKTLFETIMSYASYAFIILNTVQAIRIANLRYEIAKGYADMAKDRWNRFAARFKPLESYMISKLMNDPEVTPDWEEARRVYTECARDLEGPDRRTREGRSYGLCLDPSLGQAWQVSEELHLDDMVNLGYRDTEDVSQLRDVDRWNRRSSMLNLGRDLATFSANAARIGDKILEDGQASAVQGVGQAIGFLSYLGNSRDTAYSSLGNVLPDASSPLIAGG
jgi:hypothetical protein